MNTIRHLLWLALFGTALFTYFAGETWAAGSPTGHEMQAGDAMLGLPAVPVPADNAITKEKVILGEKLFNDKRLSTTGTVSCSTCHDANKAFTDSPLKTSKGVHDQRGTRNAPTAFDAAFNPLQFWDGRAASLEEQSLLPIINSIEMGQKNHDPVIALIKSDAQYTRMFKDAFGIEPDKITTKELSQALATFERTLVEGNSRFDRWYFRGEPTLSKREEAGYNVFIGNGRCVSCHVVEDTTALFSDGKFHNIGVGINRVPTKTLDDLGNQFLTANFQKTQVDEKVLQEPRTSELGRFAVTKELSDMGGFKTSTLRNIALTAPYMHDGSLKTLEEVIDHYNRGGASSDKEVPNAFLSGGIRPLNLTATEKADLVAFLKTLTSPRFEKR